ncbi:MAG TPA: Zn-ribbon domain-containing OB-fold protein [Burkholderiales bacterium]|nr:Zn-ribbon domain-containing OB-fold protein [Burkholderiales bacterium]
MTTTERPVPTPDAATAPYWSAAHERRLVMPRCLDCSRYHFYPRTLCPHCGSARLEWSECSGRGTVYSYTIVHRAPSPAFAADVPYVVAVVEIDEGLRLMTNVVGCAPDTVRIGMKVGVTFRQVADDVTLPVFEPLKEDAS